MNKIMKLICLLFLMLIVASCNKDPEYYTLETPVDQMLLRASSVVRIISGKDISARVNEPAMME